VLATNIEKRVWRIFRILRIASSNEQKNAHEMAEELGVSVRTFHRDRQALEQVGLPLLHDGEGYTLSSGLSFPSELDLEWDEGLALVCLIDGALESGMIPYRESLESALDKIRACIPPQIDEKIVRESGGIRVKHGPMVDMSAHRNTFDILHRAVQENKVVVMKYLGSTDEEPVSREIEPLRIFQRWLAWYVAGYCRMRSDFRIFRIDRIISLKETDESFVRPRDFDLDSFLDQAWVVERGDQSHHIRIRFTGNAARLVKELRWHPSQTIEKDTGDEIVVYFETGGLSEIADWIMRYGSEAQVLEPEELKNILTKRAKDILSQHS